MASWQDSIAAEWKRRREEEEKSGTQKPFPLAIQAFGEEEIIAMTNVLLSGKLTMHPGGDVEKVERMFAEKLEAVEDEVVLGTAGNSPAAGYPPSQASSTPSQDKKPKLHAVMVNSGSSANLLAVSAIINKMRPKHCNPGDEMLIPAVCWSTSLFPLIQLGLKPVFVDVDPVNFNVCLEQMEAIMKNPYHKNSNGESKVKAVLAVHVLGNSCDMRGLIRFVKKYDLLLVEDTCESLGSFYEYDDEDLNVDKNSQVVIHKPIRNLTTRRAYLGTAGDFGTYSFYFSHHVTSGEGGMVVCKNEDDANFLRCLRAHGWTRHLTDDAKKKFHGENADIDSRFLFVNLGYNLRPLECSAAMLQVQLRQLNKFNQNRRDNYNKVVKKLFGYTIEEQLEVESQGPSAVIDRTRGHACANAANTFSADKDGNVYASDVMRVMQPAVGTNPAWFGIAICLHRAFAHQLRDFQEYLDQNGVENRPVISGNFLRQPCVKMYQDCVSSTSGPYQQAEDFPGADALHKRGFFVGVHQVPLKEEEVAKLASILSSFKFKRKEVVLVTGGNGMLGRHVRDVIDNAAWSGEVQSIVENAEWHFVSRSSHGDLRDRKVVESIFKEYQPTVVLHCAASLKSVMEMSAKPVQFWHDNVDVNNNVLATAHKFQAWSGRTKVISVLSTVMFGFGGLKPQSELKEGEKVTDVVEYPLTADQALVGVPHMSSESYGYAKRALLLTSEWYKKEFGCDFHTILPGNIYGEFGNFEAGTAPLVNALVSKAATAAKAGTVNFDVHGSGTPERQLLYTRDLAKVMIWTVGLDFAARGITRPLVVCGEEVAISKVAESVIAAVKGNTQLAMLPGVNMDLKINYLGGNDGPQRRTADSSDFLKQWKQSYNRDFQFTPFDLGCANSMRWFLSEAAKTSA